MQREGYVPPTAGGSGAGAGSSRPGGGYGDAPRQTSMKYLCADCGKSVTLNKADPIRCKECGFRILYKERTKRMVQFEAR
ncbi:DNA-directed RNA polymerase core subunit rpc10 [Orbilia blumenaviensis]|uniref:DNA-directed RNA polymerase core subunit rpc10 n=1 Tax=Orbilia blumenaviensis TaxID=1796055 RepID=A0AAV9VNW7_9PEZI